MATGETSDESRKDLTVICVSYKRYREIHILINSFLCQTMDNWKLLIIHDGPDEQMQAEVAPYLERHKNIQFMCTETRHNDWGHTLRKMGIEMTDTEFLMLTNDDNYYAPKFLQYMFEAIRADNLDLVLCDMVHSHRNPRGRFKTDYEFFETLPQLFWVDVGTFILRTDRAQAVGFVDKSHDADGIFVEDVMKAHNVVSLLKPWRHNLRYLFRGKHPNKKTLRVGKVNRVLYVHN